MKAKMARIVLTGATGFVGRYLAPMIAKHWPDADLILTSQYAGASSMALDVCDADNVDKFISSTAPTALIHLAAIASVPLSLRDPQTTWRVNVMGTLNLIEAIRRFAPACHLLYVSSAEVYGRTAFEGKPVREGAPLEPANPYAASKAAADIMAREAAGRDLMTTIARPFNHTGPGQADIYAIPSFCRQIAEIESGQRAPTLLVGNLDDERDFLDVRDVVQCYVEILAKGPALRPGQAFNIASGVPRRVGDVLSALLAMSNAKIHVEVDPARVRATRIPRIVGDPGLARSLLGWKPSIEFERTLGESLDHWRQHVGTTMLR